MTGRPPQLDPAADVGQSDRRRLSWLGLVVLLLAFTLLTTIVNVTILHTSGMIAFPDTGREVDLAVSRAASALIVALAVPGLGWRA